MPPVSLDQFVTWIGTVRSACSEGVVVLSGRRANDLGRRLAWVPAVVTCTDCRRMDVHHRFVRLLFCVQVACAHARMPCLRLWILWFV